MDFADLSQIETRTINDITIKVNRYHTNTCSSECSGFAWAEGTINIQCRLFNKNVLGGLFEKQVGVFERCAECLRSFPDPLYAKVDGVPEFTIGHEYRYRRRGQHRTYLCVYIGTDHLSRPGFETPYHTWYGDISGMEWMSVEPIAECIHATLHSACANVTHLKYKINWDVHSSGPATAVHIRDSHSDEQDEVDELDTLGEQE